MEAEAEKAGRFELPTAIAESNQLIKHYELNDALTFGASQEESLGKPRTMLVSRYVDRTTGNT